MSAATGSHDQDHSDRVMLCALQAVPADEVPAVEAQISGGAGCRQEMAALCPIIETFVAWPTDVLRPSASLWGRLAQRIAADPGREPTASARPVCSAFDDPSTGWSRTTRPAC